MLIHRRYKPVNERGWCCSKFQAAKAHRILAKAVAGFLWTSDETTAKLYKEQKNFLQKLKGFRDCLSYSTPNKQGEMPLPHIKKWRLYDGMGQRLGNNISPCFFTFLSGGV